MNRSSASPNARPRVLGMFAKWPAAGLVKTRLAADTSPGWAAEVAAAFLQDLIGRLSALDAERVLAFAPSSSEGRFRELIGDRFRLVPQKPGELGERMAHFFQEHLRTGAERVVLVGSDSPHVPMAYIEQAFDELNHADVVVGPAMDGGYYLIGCTGRVPPIFDGVNWGSCRVLAETIARLEDSPCRLAVLPPWYDVDTLEDWYVLDGHLRAWRRAQTEMELPCTSRLMERWRLSQQ